MKTAHTPTPPAATANRGGDDGDDDPIAWYGSFPRRSLETILEEPRTPLLPSSPRPIYTPTAPSRRQYTSTPPLDGARKRTQTFDPKECMHTTQSSLSSLQSLVKTGGSFIENPVDFPDGGPHAWAVVGAAATAHFCTVGVAVGCAGAWADIYALQDLGVPVTAVNVSVIPAAMVCAMLGSAAFLNRRYDRHPPWWLLPGSSLLFALFICLASLLSTAYSALVVVHFFSGVAAGGVLSATTAVVESWFLTRRGLALAVASLGGPVGGSVVPAMMLSPVPAIGIGWTIRVVGLMVCGLLGAVCVIARIKYSRRDGGRTRRRPLGAAMYMGALTEGSYLLLLGAVIFVACGSMVPLTLALFQARQLAFSEPVTTLVLPVFSLGALAAQIASPYAACALGRFNVTVSGALLGAIFPLGVWTSSPGPAALATTMTVVGAATGLFASGVPELIEVSMPAALRTPEGSSFRARVGLLLVAAGAASMAGVPAAGESLSGKTGAHAFLGPQVICGVSFALAAVLLLGMRGLVVGAKALRA